MTQGGVFYPQPKWERRIAEIGSGLLLPTPTIPNGGGTGRSGKRINEIPSLQGMASRGMWPTPKASGNRNSRAALIDEKGSGAKPSGLSLEQAVEVHMGILPRELNHVDELPPKYRKLWPTPTVQDAENNGGPSQATSASSPLNSLAGGKLNPMWVEWLMGWPIGMTGLERLETGRFRSWLQQHGGC